jgi:hypothetical protein
VSYTFGLLIESIVAILLMLTIAYCVILNERLKRLRADEQAMKATVGELVAATEIAERAVAGLKVTANECDETLGERLRAAERVGGELVWQLRAGDALVERLARLVGAAGPDTAAPQPPAAPDPKAVAAAAHVVAERLRRRAAALAA